MRKVLLIGILLVSLAACNTQPQKSPAAPVTASSSSSSQTASSESAPIHVGPGFAINEFIVDFPAGWILVTRDKIENVIESYDVMDARGSKVASLQCPIRETGYEGWDFQNLSRKFQKNGTAYGVTLWIGTPWASAKDNGPLNILFFHHNDFEHWGEDYYHSCEIVSFGGKIDAKAMERIYKSVR